MSDNPYESPDTTGKAPARGNPKPTRWLVRTLMVVAIVGVLVALLLPSFRTAREPARRMSCANNLKQIALALHNYEDEYDCLPPAYTVDAEGNPVYSGGESGVAERNLLRYYFAFIAFFSELEEKDQQKRHDGQLTFWFDQIEKYPQLYEMSREKYLDQKRKERVNQIALQGSQQ